MRCIRVGEVRDPWGYHRPLCVPISILASLHVSRSGALRRSRATISRSVSLFLTLGSRRAIILWTELLSWKTLSCTVASPALDRDPLSRTVDLYFYTWLLSAGYRCTSLRRRGSATERGCRAVYVDVFWKIRRFMRGFTELLGC